MSADTPILALFDRLLTFLVRRRQQAQLAQGIYAERIDDDWSFVFNASTRDLHSGAACDPAMEIPPLTFVLSWRDAPAGLLNPFAGGLLAVDPETPSEQQLLAILAEAA